MKKITNWTAKRAGGRITIYGTSADGLPVRIPGVDQIACDAEGFVIAVAKDGEKYLLGGVTGTLPA